MPARGLLEAQLLDEEGNEQGGTTLDVYEADGTTLLAQPMYSTATGGVVVPNPVPSDANGRVQVWVDAPQRASVKQTGGAGDALASAFYHDPAELVDLSSDQTVTGTKTNVPLATPTIHGKATFAGPGKLLEGLAEPLPVYYAGQGTDYTKLAVSEGAAAAPTTSEHPMVRLYRTITPQTTIDGHVFANVDIGSRVTGTIQATGNELNGGRVLLYGMASYNISNATGDVHSVFGGIFHVVAESPVCNANALLALAYCGARGGQALELDIVNAGTGVIEALPRDATGVSHPEVTGSSGTTGMTILGQALGTDQRNTVTITDGDGADTFTVTVNGMTTGPIAWNADVATVQAAIYALPGIGGYDIGVSGTPGSVYYLGWGTMLAATALTVTSLGSGCSAVCTQTQAATENRYNESAILVQSSGPTQGFRHGFKPMPFAIANDGYAVDLVSVSGIVVNGTTAAARTIRLPNEGAIWAANGAGTADLPIIYCDAGDRTALLSDQAVVAQNSGGTVAYATFSPGGTQSYGPVYPGGPSGGQTAFGIRAHSMNLANTAEQDLGLITGLVHLFDPTTGHQCLLMATRDAGTMTTIATSSVPTFTVGTDAAPGWAVYYTGTFRIRNWWGAARTVFVNRIWSTA